MLTCSQSAAQLSLLCLRVAPQTASMWMLRSALRAPSTSRTGRRSADWTPSTCCCTCNRSGFSIRTSHQAWTASRIYAGVLFHALQL